MSGLSPVEVAIAAYDAKLNEELGNPPGYVLGFAARQPLRTNPMILAMLAAHEKAVRQQVVDGIRDHIRQRSTRVTPREHLALGYAIDIARGEVKA